jgi:hypothetical protein
MIRAAQTSVYTLVQKYEEAFLSLKRHTSEEILYAQDA